MSDSTHDHDALLPRSERDSSYALDRIRDSLRGLRYGEVTVIVHDGLVVQVERTEKVRLERK